MREEIRNLALVSCHGPPNEELLELSHDTIWSCLPGGDSTLTLVDVHCIDSVVVMIPHPEPIVPQAGLVDVHGQFCVVEKPGLEVAILGGAEEPMGDGDNDL